MALPGFEDIPGLSQKVIDQSMNCLRWLQTQTSEENPCCARKFQRAYGFRPAQFAALISYLRMQGYPIGSNGKGYFWASIASELSETIAHMKSRIGRQERTTNAIETTQATMREGYQQQEIFK